MKGILPVETPVIREEVQAFLQAGQSLLAFKQYTPFTSTERKAITAFVQMLGSEVQQSPDDPPRSYLPVDG
jgi:hypothetical protein